MHYMWTDPGSVADFDPGPASSSLEAYGLFSSCGLGSFQNISTLHGKEQCPPCSKLGECTYDQIVTSSYVCSDCDRCSAREYVDSWSQCDGAKQDPFTPTCRSVLSTFFFSIVFFMLTDVKNHNRSCKFQCKVGQYVGDLCTGFTETNTETCNDCLPCPYGHYHINHSGYLEGYRWVEEQQACNGTGILPSDGYTSCRRCDTCPNGKFANDVGNCTGNGIWKTSFKCQDCLPCESGPILAMMLVFLLCFDDNNY